MSQLFTSGGQSTDVSALDFSLQVINTSILFHYLKGPSLNTTLQGHPKA